MDVIFDTNVFSNILDGKLTIDQITSWNIKVKVTHIQLDELTNSPDESLRSNLLNLFEEIVDETLSTESFILDVSRFGFFKFGAHDGIYEGLKKEKFKHINDALIGEVAIRQNILLLTDDKKLKKKVKTLGGEAMSISDFVKTYGF